MLIKIYKHISWTTTKQDLRKYENSFKHYNTSVIDIIQNMESSNIIFTWTEIDAIECGLIEEQDYSEIVRGAIIRILNAIEQDIETRQQRLQKV